jgi:hypothetical protein
MLLKKYNFNPMLLVVLAIGTNLLIFSLSLSLSLSLKHIKQKHTNGDERTYMLTIWQTVALAKEQLQVTAF